MDAGELRISSYNYGVGVMPERVRALFTRDDQLLGDVLLRVALMRTSSPAWQHVITGIEVLAKSESPDSPMIADYGSFLFLMEILGKEALFARLSRLSEREFQIGKFSVTSTTGIGVVRDSSPVTFELTFAESGTATARHGDSRLGWGLRTGLKERLPAVPIYDPTCDRDRRRTSRQVLSNLWISWQTVP